MVNRPIVARLRERRPAACSLPPTSAARLCRWLPTLDTSGGGEEVTGEMSGVFFANFKVLR